MKLPALGLIVAVAAAGLAAAAMAAAPPAQVAPFAAGVDVMTAPVQPGYFVHQKVVYQNDGGLPDDKAYYAFILRNIANHLEATGGDAEIRMVSFGRGVQLFVLAKTDPDLAAQIDALRAKGVRFLVCRNSMRGMKVRPEDLYKVPPTDVVPAGVAELARLQGMGFVLVHP
jgi:intracellular sulfur oxidation DsrE/DsrF family protein